MRSSQPAVLLIVYRRPGRLAKVMERIRAARPRTLFIAADVSADTSDDEHRAALRIATDVDWPCDVEVDIAPRPLGCSVRIETAVDRAFESVERLVVIEDDILVDPAFFDWAGAMFDRFDGDPTVGQVGGRNELVAWPTGDADHFVARLGSVWGWGTWRSVWQRHRASPRPEPPVGDSLIDRHLRTLESLPGERLVWDVEWGRFLGCSGLRSIVPTINMVDNIGFGDGATHTTNLLDLRADFPTAASRSAMAVSYLRSKRAPATGTAPPSSDLDTDTCTDTYDEWALLIGLVAAYRRPAVMARLARLALNDGRLELDAQTVHHLEPFRRADSTLAALHHLQSCGVGPSRVEHLAQALRLARHESVAT